MSAREKRAEYGQEILQSLPAKLPTEFGRGYSARNLANTARFAEVFQTGTAELRGRCCAGAIRYI